MDQEQMRELRELIEFLKTNEIAEFDMEHPDLKVRLKFAGKSDAAAADLGQLSRLMAAMPQSGVSHAMPVAHAASTAGVAETPAIALSDAESVETLHEVKSPIVGTFYESPSPGTASFVKVGDQVEVGQVLCIIEAMKLMNEIEADAAGEVVKRIATSGQPVEYGQPLFAIRPRS